MSTESHHGILHYHQGQDFFGVERPLPSPDLRQWVEHYWLVRWNSPTPRLQNTLPHPSVHITFEGELAEVYGVVTGKFSRQIEGQGRVFGIKFRPGGFYPWLQTPVARYTNTITPLQRLWPSDPARLTQRLLTTDDTPQLVAWVEDWLRQCPPAPDPTVDLVSDWVQAIHDTRHLTTVEALSQQVALSKRHLQRLFQVYVGVSPKWVIQRYRLHEIIDQVAAGVGVDWAQLAVELGYCDQSHLIKDFKAIVGVSPAAYAKQSGA